MVKTFLKVINIAYFRISDTFTVTGGGGGGERAIHINVLSGQHNCDFGQDKINTKY